MKIENRRHIHGERCVESCWFRRSSIIRTVVEVLPGGDPAVGGPACVPEEAHKAGGRRRSEGAGRWNIAQEASPGYDKAKGSRRAEAERLR